MSHLFNIEYVVKIIELCKKNDLYWEIQDQDCGQCVEITAYDIHDFMNLEKHFHYKRCSDLKRGFEQLEEWINEQKQRGLT